MAEEKKTDLGELEDTFQRYRKEEIEETIEHYRRNRDKLVQELSETWSNPKPPAISGTIVLLPLAVAAYVLYWLFTKIDLIPGVALFDVTTVPVLNTLIKTAAGLAVLFVIVVAVGRFVRTDIGYRVERALDHAMEEIPILGFIYSLTKVTTDTVLTGTEDFQSPVKLEFQGVRITGFKTGNTTADGRPIIFIPTSPNITTGFVLEVDPDDIIGTDQTVEEALKGVLSAGLASSDGRAED